MSDRIHIHPLDDVDYGELEISNAILDWEKLNDIRCPNAYRNLMNIQNGGYIYPNVSNFNIPKNVYDSGEPFVVIEMLYDWNYVAKHWEKQIYGKGTPPEHLIIGDAQGGLEILLSVAPDTFGKVYFWFHSTNIWGTDGNDESALHLQANSLGEFLEALYDTQDKIGLDTFDGEERLRSSKAFTIDELK